LDDNTLYKQNREVIMRILIEIYESINNNQECFLHYDEDKFLFLKYIEEFKQSKNFQPIEDHDVPVPLMNLLSPSLTILYMEGDINLYKIINLIDGVNCVKKISFQTEIEQCKVKDYLQNLSYHGLIKLVDIFSFSNRYCLTPDIHKFIDNEQMKQECVKYISKSIIPNDESAKPFKKEKKDLIDINEMIKLYLQLKKEQEIGKFLCENSTKVNKINIIKFLHFGIINGFVRRAHEYLLHSEKTKLLLFSTDFYEKNMKDKQVEKNCLKAEEKVKRMNDELEKLMNENACLDKICVNLEVDKEMIKELTQAKHAFIVCK